MYGRRPRRQLAYDPQQAGAECWRCPLRGKLPVLPNGPLDAEMMIIGEAPGYNEEIQGRGFVGASGSMLDELLREAGIERKRVWISNALMCRAEVPDVKGSKRYDLPTFLAYIRKENARRRKVAGKGGAWEKIENPLSCCRPRLLNELRNVEANAKRNGRPNGAVIIALGNYALQALTGHLGIQKWRGSPLPIDVTELEALKLK